MSDTTLPAAANLRASSSRRKQRDDIPSPRCGRPLERPRERVFDGIEHGSRTRQHGPGRSTIGDDALPALRSTLRIATRRNMPTRFLIPLT